MNGRYIILTINIIITIFLKNAHLLYFNEKREGKTRAYLWIMSAYIIYITCAVFRQIDPLSGIGGSDASVYKNIYNQADTGFITYLFDHSNEKGYLLINWIVKNTVDDYRFALWIFHSIAFIFETIFILNIQVKRYNIFTWMGTFLIIGNLFFMFSMMRNSIIIPMLSVAVIKMKQDHFGKALVITAFALLIHYSAIIMFLYLFAIYFYRKFNLKSRWKMVLLFIFSFIICSLALELTERYINIKYSAYIVTKNIAYKSYLAIIILLLLGTGIWKEIKERQMQIEMIILLFTLICFVINLKYSIVYRMIYNVLPIIYMYIMKLTENLRLLKLKRYSYSAAKLMLGCFSLVYLPYRCYALIFWEYSSGLPFILSILQ